MKMPWTQQTRTVSLDELIRVFGEDATVRQVSDAAFLALSKVD
jgi:hypothetical protein